MATFKVEQNNLKATIAASYNKLYGNFSSSELHEVGNYKIIKLIGKGSFGKVYLANHKLTRQKVVLKTGEKNDPNVVREVFYHRQFDFPYITKLFEVIVTENKVWMVLEYCPRKELYEYLLSQQRIPLEESKNLFSQIVSSVFYAHSLHCVHRDLKLENVLLDKNGNVKLTDFGFTKECATTTQLETICGTTVYMAPEMIEQKPYDGFKIDIWSLGIILYTMIHGTMPFDEDDEIQTKWKIVNEEPRLVNNLASTEASDLIKMLLNKKPLLRPCLETVLLHPFLQPYGELLLDKTRKLIKKQKQDYALFHGKIERRLLKKLKQSGFDIVSIKQSVIRRKCDALSGLWFLLLEREKKSELSKYPKRSRSLISVRRDFNIPSSAYCSENEFLNSTNRYSRPASLRRILTKQSDYLTNDSCLKKSAISSQSFTSSISNNPQKSTQLIGIKKEKRGLFAKMTKFFRTKKYILINHHYFHHKTGFSPESSNLETEHQCRFRSDEFRALTPKTSLGEKSIKSSKNNDNHKQDLSRSNDIIIEEPQVKKLKYRPKTEIFDHKLMNNYDSETENLHTTNSYMNNDLKKTTLLKQRRPSSMVSQHSEISNDTYNSDYSTDGNQFNLRMTSPTNEFFKNGHHIFAPIMNENSFLYSKTLARRSFSIMSSASSTSERSSRTDSFYDITTTSSPTIMNVRALSPHSKLLRADSTFPRIPISTNTNSPLFAKRSRAFIGKNRRLNSRHMNQKSRRGNGSTTQSIIQEESSFDDNDQENDNVHQDATCGYEKLEERRRYGIGIQTNNTSPSQKSASKQLFILQNLDIPTNFTIARLRSDTSIWSQKTPEDVDTDILLKKSSDDYEEIGAADHEDNSSEVEEGERPY